MITGSGTVATETRPLAEWSAVGLSCPGTFEVEIGANQGITVEADDNILPLIETFVAGDRLVVRFTPGLGSIRPVHPIRFRAATPMIDGMAVSGAGNIRAPQIEHDCLSLDVSGSGSIGINAVHLESLETRISGSGGISTTGQATSADMRISGSGDLSARDLTIQQARIHVSGSGSAMVRVEREIDGRISGSGSIVYSGQPSVSIRTSGSGRAIQMPE